VYQREENGRGYNLWKVASVKVRFLVKLEKELRKTMTEKRGKMISYPMTRGQKFRSFYGTLQENFIITVILYLSYFYPQWINLLVVFLSAYLPFLNGMKIDKKVKYQFNSAIVLNVIGVLSFIVKFVGIHMISKNSEGFCTIS